jgi:ribose 5-phosphate isomerase B
MKIAVASDHAGLDLKSAVKKHLESQSNENLSFEISDYGTNSKDSCDYPDYAYPAAKSVADNENQFGIIICGSGVGVSIVANKVPGVRAANVFNQEMASLAREHNNANVLTLAARFIDESTALQMVDTFLKTEFTGGRHQSRLDKIKEC